MFMIVRSCSSLLKPKADIQEVADARQSQTISNKEKQKKMFMIVRCCSSLLKPKADV